MKKRNVMILSLLLIGILTGCKKYPEGIEAPPDKTTDYEMVEVDNKNVAKIPQLIVLI